MNNENKQPEGKRPEPVDTNDELRYKIKKYSEGVESLSQIINDSEKEPLSESQKEVIESHKAEVHKLQGLQKEAEDELKRRTEYGQGL